MVPLRGASASNQLSTSDRNRSRLLARCVGHHTVRRRPGRSQLQRTKRPDLERVDDRRPHVVAAERNVRRHVVRDGIDVDLPAVWGDDDDPVGDAPDGDPAVRLYGERVERIGGRNDAPTSVPDLRDPVDGFTTPGSPSSHAQSRPVWVSAT